MKVRGLLLLVFVLLLYICRGRPAVVAAVSFSESDFGETNHPYEWSEFQATIPTISNRYKRKIKPLNEKRYYCGVNIDCSSTTLPRKKNGKDFRIRRD